MGIFKVTLNDRVSYFCKRLRIRDVDPIVSVFLNIFGPQELSRTNYNRSSNIEEFIQMHSNHMQIRQQ